VHRKVPAGFGGRLHGKARSSPPRTRDLAVQPTLFQERDSRTVPSDDVPTGSVPADAGPATAASQGPGASGPDQPPPDSDPPSPGPDGPGGDSGPGGTGGDSRPGGSGGPSGPGPAPRPGADAGPSLAALVTITIPLATYQGRSEAPGDAGGYGILDGDDARDLAAAAARHPATPRPPPLPPSLSPPLTPTAPPPPTPASPAATPREAPDQPAPDHHPARGPAPFCGISQWLVWRRGWVAGTAVGCCLHRGFVRRWQYLASLDRSRPCAPSPLGALH
jgi:hypothetical protein